MADIVNLRRVRKARNRVEAEKSAARNRVAFGQTKADRAIAQAEAEQARRRLDGLRRVGPAEETDAEAPSAE